MIEKLVKGLRDLKRAYVSLLETGRDRIISHGGTCDSVEEMERGDPSLIAAQALIDQAEAVLCPGAMPEDMSAKVRELLEAYFWLPTLQANKRYKRLHDDHDGEYNGWLAVTIGEDGDAWVDPVNLNAGGLRFRMPMIGGGSSQYTRTALVILAEAIRLDNERAPQTGPRKGDT